MKPTADAEPDIPNVRFDESIGIDDSASGPNGPPGRYWELEDDLKYLQYDLPTHVDYEITISPCQSRKENNRQQCPTCSAKQFGNRESRCSRCPKQLECSAPRLADSLTSRKACGSTAPTSWLLISDWSS